MDDDPLLRTVSDPVDPGEDITDLLRAMVFVLEERQARGLAAIQIGVPKRVLIVRETISRTSYRYLAFINPQITRTLNRLAVEREGCLSVPPRKWGDVARPAKCDATWLSQDGHEQSATLTGETARIFQHEFDHLNGVLMTDKKLVPA